MVKLDQSPSDQRTIELLERRKIVWFATVHPDGKPHVVPVWFLWHDGAALVLSQPGTQKLRNLRQNLCCTLALDDSEEGHQPVVFEGTATLEAGPLSSEDLDRYVTKYGQMLSEMNWTIEQMVQEYSQVLRVVPTKFLEVS